MGESISKLSKEIRLLKQKLDLEKIVLPAVASTSIINKAQKDLTQILKKDLSEFENTHFANNWRGHKIVTFKVPNEIRFEDGKVIIDSIRMNPIINNESFKEIPSVLFNKIKNDLIEFIGEDVEVREITFDYSIYNENDEEHSLQKTLSELKNYLSTTRFNEIDGIQVYELEDDECITRNIYNDSYFKAFSPINLVTTNVFNASDLNIGLFDHYIFIQEFSNILKKLSISWKTIACMNNHPSGNSEKSLFYDNITTSCEDTDKTPPEYIETPPEFNGCQEEIIEEEVHYPDQSFLNELREYTSEAREELLNKTKETMRNYAKYGHYRCPLTELSQMNDEISKVIISRLVCELFINVYKDNNGVLIADWSEII